MNCKYCNREINIKGALVIHERSCKKNPNQVPGHFIGKKHSEESKIKQAKSFSGKLPKNLYDLSARTLQKVLKRLEAKCFNCGWDKTTCDIHHIIPRHKGGVNDHNNLTILCPNCHRLAHQNKITTEFKTIQEEYGEEWRIKYYSHIPKELYENEKSYIRKPKRKSEEISEKCKLCGEKIPRSNITQLCGKCAMKNRRKVERPNKEELEILVKEMTLTEIGKKYKVTDNAIVRWCKSYQISYRKNLRKDTIMDSLTLEEKEYFQRKLESKLKRKSKEEIIEERMNIVKNSGIDFSKWGWGTQLGKQLHICKQEAVRWVKKYIPDFYEKECFKKTIQQPKGVQS